ncbi:PhzF family phenazine biosynthesis protein [Brevibacillus migulae]|uniref:PhzF family phenazine biosynthesis protein n=1 Tax=Brevibacillus migulae TaxID=1644114 RepID=UPI00106E58FB|nr:PhzF family phenazine biosynthesis isomerase [Brevibacillus migulae]
MDHIKVYHIDAFSKLPDRGNPAGVVLDGETLTEEQMRKVAEKVGFNETAFVCPSAQADLKIRFFTPGHEMNVCGHATMAAVYALQTKGWLGDRKEITIETKAGVLPIRIDIDEEVCITMRQAAPQFQAFSGSVEALAHAMGIEETDIETKLPILYGSTGIWTLLVPIKTLAAFTRMKPKNERFPSVLKDMPRASVHPFCLETYDANAHMHARHFSSPFSGTVEDPVTGTASGVMGAYYARYLNRMGDQDTLQLVIEQGQEIGRDGRVRVTVTNGDIVEITGHAVYVADMEIDL